MAHSKCHVRESYHYHYDTKDRQVGMKMEPLGKSMSDSKGSILGSCCGLTCNYRRRIGKTQMETKSEVVTKTLGDRGTLCWCPA